MNLIIKKYTIKKAFEKVIKNRLIEIETEKIKKRQHRRKIREQAEKKLYGKIKTRRKTLTKEEKNMIYDKFNNECTVCGRKEGLHIHHKDGNPANNKISNLVALCGVCHKKAHMKVR